MSATPVWPAVFVSHGAPVVALEDDDYTRALRDFGLRYPRPTAIVVMSAHWEARGPIRVNSGDRPPLIYDFSGFSDPLYRLDYKAPGSPDLAHVIASRLSRSGILNALEPARGWDHGLWIPLRLMYPEAEAPVVELSLPIPRRPEDLLGVGEALARLRERGVLLMGSGGIVHNLARMRLHETDPPAEPWARAFDDWMKGHLERAEYAAALSYRQAAPHAELAAPTPSISIPSSSSWGARGRRTGSCRSTRASATGRSP